MTLNDSLSRALLGESINMFEFVLFLVPVRQNVSSAPPPAVGLMVTVTSVV